LNSQIIQNSKRSSCQIFDKKIACYFVLFENSKRHLCREEQTEFSQTTLKKVFEIGVFILRDFVVLLLLISLNVLIYLRVKSNIQNKKLVLNHTESREKEDIQSELKETNIARKKHNRQSKIMEKTQQRATFMVLFNGFNYLFGRIPILVFFIWNNLENWSDSLMTCLEIAVLAVYLSYTIKFFLYYLSNNRFRRSFNKKALRLIQFFHIFK
jgi:hypothetical protein